ncbi:squamosa promoter-binding-like protein 1 isoform X1 [Malus sylvestris]|uniref:squamosa promoter-binding-like protein 1 isoform X1 n=1 Tax=Malus sylvestris TaxID=3752 RepID=UPI0021AC831D|nr:squamosa promoter-binding-like protein 1 isoform X1 [Malus sylvestris]
MEAFGGRARNFYGTMVPDLKGAGKKSLEWDLNDWKWDGDLFTASPLNAVPSDCRSSQLFPLGLPETPSTAGLSTSSSSGSDGICPGNEKGKRELEKRRRASFAENEGLTDEVGSLNLKLGGQAYPIMEGEVQNGKKTKIVGTTLNRAVCQVEDCKADLSSAKDYHRRHKVCDMHSKATKAVVGNVLQRFCQQCSRFHGLQEFDEGKRSCRRRLAGHNRRRRKTHPDTVVNGGSLNDEGGSSYLLISLLRILSNMHSNSSDQTKDQDLLSHLLKNLANLSGTVDGRNMSALLTASQGLINGGASIQTAQKVPDTVSNGCEPSKPSVSASKMDDYVNGEDPSRPIRQCSTVPASDFRRISSVDADHGGLQIVSGLNATKPFPSRDSVPSTSVAPEPTMGRMQLNGIDLNNTYDDSQDYLDNLGNSHAPVNSGTVAHGFPLWMRQDSQKSSPPQTSGTSCSTSSSSSGDAQSRTDRIVFKLFGKDPNDLPFVLRAQILDWLSHSPTDIESYIRPGCIILTVYLRLEKSTWEELCCNLGSIMKQLLHAANDPFWTTGWVYTRVQHSVAFTYNGQVVLDTPLPLKSHKNCRISCIKPIAVSLSERAEFVVKGFNLSRATTRLLCALEGKYLVQETCYDLMDGADTTFANDQLQCLRFSCSIPNVTGRGLIEVEDHGLSGCFFPFIVAEQEVCSEICTLEGAIEVAETADNIQTEPEKLEAKNQALDFVHELGWLLHRCHTKFRLGHGDPNLELFSFRRFKLLMEFSMDRDWCAVVKKLLGILLEGTVDAGEHPSIELALLDMSLLHGAVQRKCRPMVELLLRFVLDKGWQQVDGDGSNFLFKPDAVGPMGLTPLHVAASTDGCENILDALTDDPGKVGIEAWKNARDSTGLTPNDYACLRGRYTYVQIVQRKINKKHESGHVVLDIPGVILDSSSKQKQLDGHKSSKVSILETERIDMKAMQAHCKQCEMKLAYGNTRSFVYRPAMLSMVAIAAVCVCVALLFKSSPEVLYVFQPFRWELLEYGPS